MYKCKFCLNEFSNKGSLNTHENRCEYILSIKDKIFNLYVIEEKSINYIKNEFKIGAGTINKVIGDKKRSPLEGKIVAHRKYPERFRHTDETKEKMRISRLNYMKNNPEKTAWRKSNLSYPEKLFLDKINSLKWGEKYSIEREWPVYPFFIDFAFMNEKVAVEIDGSQHLLPDRKLKDNEKDALLKNNGWIIVRVTENEIKTNLNNFIIELENILKTTPLCNFYSYGIFSPKRSKITRDDFNKEPVQRKNNSKRINGKLTQKELERAFKQRKVERPSKEILLNEIKELGYRGTGRKYGVSDNAIRKWVK